MTIGTLFTDKLRLLAAEGDQQAQVLSHNDQYKSLSVFENRNADASDHTDAITQIHSRLEFFDNDRYSVTLRMLSMSEGVSITDDIHEVQTYLSAKAAEIVRQLSYLEEPLAVWELDSRENMAQLRSLPPQRDGAERSYWEVVLKVDGEPSISIARYSWSPGMPEREIVAYPATFALVARIANSLETVLRAETV
ncbi:MAG: hypothetical protein GFH27_549289n285 [Chloroflexi bacterium AL-W]|nr:hypothetical protein [Chloroflexi bacterium AL-N1]NOK67017.1 hypothetical protein [Chloroflexi bacterium AL-N10]NOK74691.1 hypothetical protein [Chloroflexi bacterium AL-N5]NOK81619.1 hypothetical protein [Chloroflexi bacterium AL-W]NOK89089.1 hypothetical protein [Chloroflexi bacterium AL-N15]